MRHIYVMTTTDQETCRKQCIAKGLRLDDTDAIIILGTQDADWMPYMHIPHLEREDGQDWQAAQAPCVFFGDDGWWQTNGVSRTVRIAP